jgi:tetratricopeptide (TPR) repeat protein
MAARSGDLLKAEEWFRRSLAISERTNEREHQCWCNIALAIALQDQGNLQGAAEGIRRALAIARAMKSARNIGGALIALADLRVTQAVIAAKLQGNTRITHHSAFACTRLLLRARSTIQRAIVFDGLETELVVEGKVILANIYFLLGDLQAARQEAMRTMEEARRHELTRMLARSYRLLGRILAAQGEHEQAGACFEEALQIFRDHAMRLDYARALHGYGDTLLERSTPAPGVYQTGLAYLNEARTIFAACHAAIDLDWVDQSLTNTTSEILEI